MAVVLIGWAFFRATDLSQATSLLTSMLGLGHGDGREYNAWQYLNHETLIVLPVAMIGSTPILPMMKRLLTWLESPSRGHEMPAESPPIALSFLRNIAVVLMFVACSAKLFAGTSNPFIYFRF
jgi:alginate O-acetyltransferase complex protein AlgI